MLNSSRIYASSLATSRLFSSPSVCQSGIIAPISHKRLLAVKSLHRASPFVRGQSSVPLFSDGSNKLSGKFPSADRSHYTVGSIPIPRKQRSVVVDPTLSPNKGPESMVVLHEQPVPTPDAGHVLIHVSYAGINGPDVIQRKGLYPPPSGHSETLGLEASGTIVALGEGARRFSIGQHVCALLNGGGYAEYVTVPEGMCMRVPNDMSLKDAASLPEVYCTVWSNIFETAKFQKGETVLVHGGGSGIDLLADEKES